MPAKNNSPITTASWFRAASASVASKGMLVAIRYAREKKDSLLRHLPRHADRLRGVCAQRLRAGRREFQRVRSRALRTASSTSSANCAASKNWAAPCVWVHGPARSNPERSPTRSTAKSKSANAIVTATNSTANTKSTLIAGGLRISGSTPDGTYVEMVELPDHPHFIGCQFHPEFKSKPLEPHPLFKTFIGAAYEHGLAAIAPRKPQPKSRCSTGPRRWEGGKVNIRQGTQSDTTGILGFPRVPLCPLWFKLLA